MEPEKKVLKKHSTKRISFGTFEALALKNGYRITPKKGEVFKNVKSLITVTNIETGEEHQSSYSRFRDGFFHSQKTASAVRKLTIEEVKNRVKEAGFIWIEGTVYISKNIPIKVRCYCGNDVMVAVGNLRSKRSGCIECSRYKRMRPWSHVIDVTNEYRCKIITPESEYKGRDTSLDITCGCGNDMKKTVGNFIKASWCNECGDERRKETNMERYGAENYFASEEGKEIVKKYWKENYDVEHNMQIEETKQKAKDTCMKNHGVDCIFKTKGNRELRDRAIMQKYGSYTNLQTRQFYETMIERHGYKHAMQNPEIFARACKTKFKLKEYIFPSGRVEYVQGYEGMCLDYLLAEGIDEDDIVVHPYEVPEIFYEYNGGSHRYFMDIYIKSEDRAIEVKSSFTYYDNREMNEAKWLTTSKMHTCFEVFIFDPKYKDHHGYVLSKLLVDGEVTSVGFNTRVVREIPSYSIY
jgi:hypothetical protein